MERREPLVGSPVAGTSSKGGAFVVGMFSPGGTPGALHGATARKTQQPWFVFGLVKKERPVGELFVVSVVQVPMLVLHCMR